MGYGMRTGTSKVTIAELEDKLRRAYACREAMEGLPPGTLTDGGS